MRKGTTEKIIHRCFYSSLHPLLPLGAPDRLGTPDFPVPISFFYGDKDWTLYDDEKVPKFVYGQNRKKHGSKSSYVIISGSGHMIYHDNPEQLAEEIIKDLVPK